MNPKITTIEVGYSVTIRSNIGDFESADAHFHKKETWDVTGMAEGEVGQLWSKRFGYIKFELDGLAKAEYDETSRYGGKNEEED